ncbi:MAG: AMP-binding protein [Burkholderiales bacterium]|nr:AMP-binding protein [Burkholderiales bacterium]
MSTDHPSPASAPLPGTLEQWAAVQPDRVAVVEGDRSLTWGQWNRAADRLAAGLRERGLGRDDIVVVRTHVRLEWVVIASALAKLGCSLLGLNWRLTPTETRYVLGNSRATAIICDDELPEDLLPAFDGLALKVAVSIDKPGQGFIDYASLLVQDGGPFFSAGNPPLVIYTSGTTGLPKGVMSHQPAQLGDPITIEYMQDVRARRQGSRDDAILVTMPMHHASGPAQVWAAQGSGCLLVLMRRFDAQGALVLIEKYRVSQWTGVPTMFKRIAALPIEEVRRYDLSSLTRLTVGAAPVTYALKTWIIDNLGDCLQEGYGSTETGMISRMTPEMQKLKPGSSGLPYRHVQIEIRDEHNAVLPVGETGEIWAFTPVVIRGYLNAPALNTDTLDERGFFRTGDMGRMDEDGFLFISDRAKDMIISGGVNIYPAEVEAALQTHPAIVDAAVIGIPDDEFGESVLAFCEAKPGHAVDEAALLAHCAITLASYKRPRAIRLVDELPRNGMGKLLKRDLRAPFWKDKERKV